MPRVPRTRLLGHAVLAIAIAAILWRLREFLPPHTLPARGDPSLPFQGSDLTPVWAPWLRVAIDTLWRQHTLAFWNPFLNAGAPQFESPEAGVISFATFAGAMLPLEAAVKWTMLLHVAIGMVGTDRFARRLGVAAPFAAAGAFSFGIGTYLLDHFRVGHLSHIQPMCLAPLAMLLVWNALTIEGPWYQYAVGAGLVTGFQVLEGGTSVFVYTLLAFSLLIVTTVGPRPVQWTSRLAGVGLLAGFCCVATAAPQLLPMLSYLALTGRSGGVTLDQSSLQFHEVAHPFPTVAAVVVMSIGFGWLAARNHRAALWLAAMVALGVAAARVDAVYAFLWHYVPGFRYQRIPERATVLVGIAGPLLVAAGIEGAWRFLTRWKAAGAFAFSLGLAAFLYQSWTIAPGTPPMADPRVERAQNQAMRWLADHASGARIHIWESPDRHWGANNITVPLELEAITSYTPSEHRDYLPFDFDEPDHVTFVGASYANPARFWGLLNVRYVLSTVPRSVPGLRLAAEVGPCPVETCQPAKSAGPYVYENDGWLPRGWIVQHAIVLVGPPRPVFEAALEILRMPEFDPARTVILQATAADRILPPIDGVFTVGADAPNALRWPGVSAKEALAQLLRLDSAGLQPAGFTRHDNNDLEFRAAADGWLVASEKMALYPGWAASIDGKPAGIVRADGVLAAIRVNAGNVVRASYEPPRFRLGLALFGILIAGVVVARRVHRIG